MKTILKNIDFRAIGLLLLFLPLSSCDDFLDVDFPKDQLTGNEVFDNEATATAALLDIYAKLRDDVLLTGTNGLSIYLGLYADELDNYASSESSAYNFYTHSVLPTSLAIGTLWNTDYNLIYSTNSILEGVENSTKLDQEQKNLLRGEAFFIRGLIHFYLTELFGDIPYITSTDFTVNSSVSRLPQDEVYIRIISDLKEAKELLLDNYVSDERVKPNKYAAAALLARVYLYSKEYTLAESESSFVISNTSLYILEQDLNSVFLRDSPSTIWQLKPQEGASTQEGFSFVLPYAPPSNVALREDFVYSFENGDKRRQAWVGEISDGSSQFYFPYKYKQNDNAGLSSEYSIVFRLAEQYLIRSEARNIIGNSQGAAADLNAIRNRAGLMDIEPSTTEQFSNAILKERKFELFTEHGQRWFDLKRTGKAEEILSPIKSGWRSTDVLFPLPENELLINPNLKPQNPGY